MRFPIGLALLLPAALLLLHAPRPAAQAPDRAALDARVQRFLAEREGSWRDLNVPKADGQLVIRRPPVLLSAQAIQMPECPARTGTRSTSRTCSRS
jgi:hypothetical protein